MNKEIEKLWDYINELEKRIEDLELQIKKNNSKKNINPDDYLERKSRFPWR